MGMSRNEKEREAAAAAVVLRAGGAARLLESVALRVGRAAAGLDTEILVTVACSLTSAPLDCVGRQGVDGWPRPPLPL